MDEGRLEAIFWRAFLNNIGPPLGFSAEDIEGLSDERVTAAGREMVEGFRPAFESVGRLIGAGVNAYREEVKWTIEG